MSNITLNLLGKILFDLTGEKVINPNENDAQYDLKIPKSEDLNLLQDYLKKEYGIQIKKEMTDVEVITVFFPEE